MHINTYKPSHKQADTTNNRQTTDTLSYAHTYTHTHRALPLQPWTDSTLPGTHTRGGMANKHINSKAIPHNNRINMVLGVAKEEEA